MKRIFSSRREHRLIKVCVFLITAALIAGMAGCVDVGYDPPPSENLEIHTWYDLDAVRDNLAGDHILMNDLDSTTPGYTELASPTANGGKGWEPIGYSTYVVNYFLSGSFDGQGHEIRDLFINRPDENGVALFSSTFQAAVIKDLGMTNVTVTGADYVGGLVGSNTGSLINSYFSGNVTGEYRVGGLAGCSGGTVLNASSSGDVTGSSSVGGLFGVNMGSVNNSHSMCSVIGVDDVGGLVGYSYYGTMSNSYSTSNVTGYSDVGGLVGLNGWEGMTGGGIISIVVDSYSTGNVNGNQNVGGLVGHNDDGTVSNSFWDTQTSGQFTSDGGIGKNTTEMQDIVTFSGAGWDIIGVALNETNPAYIWNIVDDETYPFLSWQP